MTEKQRRERLSIRLEKDRTKRTNKNYWRKKKGCQEQKTREGSCYQTAQVCHGDGRRKKARLEKIVATTQLRLTLEMEEERRAKGRNEFNLVFFLQGMSLLAL